MLDPGRVDVIFKDCLFREGEDTQGHVRAEGITLVVGFHPERLESHRGEIEIMLGKLPREFRKSGGGGWSFVNACVDKDGNLWTGDHRHMEQLFLLGLGIGKVRSLMPRDAWSVLPGGMPYYVVDDILGPVEVP